MRMGVDQASDMHVRAEDTSTLSASRIEVLLHSYARGGREIVLCCL